MKSDQLDQVMKRFVVKGKGPDDEPKRTSMSETYNESGGRWAKPQHVVGATAEPPQYAKPNWSHDPVGIEPPLGIDVNYVAPVGEYREVQASLSKQSLAPQPPNEIVAPGEAEAPPASASPLKRRKL